MCGGKLARPSRGRAGILFTLGDHDELSSVCRGLVRLGPGAVSARRRARGGWRGVGLIGCVGARFRWVGECEWWFCRRWIPQRATQRSGRGRWRREAPHSLPRQWTVLGGGQPGRREKEMQTGRTSFSTLLAEFYDSKNVQGKREREGAHKNATRSLPRFPSCERKAVSGNGWASVGRVPCPSTRACG